MAESCETMHGLGRLIIEKAVLVKIFLTIGQNRTKNINSAMQRYFYKLLRYRKVIFIGELDSLISFQNILPKRRFSI